jgi:hypothetical protein
LLRSKRSNGLGMRQHFRPISEFPVEEAEIVQRERQGEGVNQPLCLRARRMGRALRLIKIAEPEQGL